MGTYLPGAGTLGWVVWSGARVHRSGGIPPNFYPPHVDVGLPVPQSFDNFIMMYLDVDL